MNSILNRTNLEEAHFEGRNCRSHFNCWNATLFVLGKTGELYWSDVYEIEKFIYSETYEVSNLRIGDILVLYGYLDDYDLSEEENQDRILHTAVYTGKNKWFHKQGANKSEFVTEEEVKDIYCEDFERSEIRRVRQ